MISTQTEGTSLENAYINTEAWQTYFQEQGLDPKEEAERYGVTNYDEAITTGADLSIPFPQYQSDFSASDHAPHFVRDTKLSEKGMTVNEQEAALQMVAERAKETEELLERIGKDSENARAVNDVLGKLTDEIAAVLEDRYDKKSARDMATVHARARYWPIYRDIIEQAKERGEELSADELAKRITRAFESIGLTIRPNATQTTVNTRKSVDPVIDSNLEKLRKGTIPKERDIYGPSLMEYVKEKFGGIRPDKIIMDHIKNGELPRSILNKGNKGIPPLGADEIAETEEMRGFNLESETRFAADDLIEALIDEYGGGAKRFAFGNFKPELLSEAQELEELEKELKAAGIDVTAVKDNEEVRRQLRTYRDGLYGTDTGEEFEEGETDGERLYQDERGFTESDNPTPEERAEARRQYDEVEKKYKGTPLWMKAPNGQPTRLTKHQWITVHTPNFLRWFGDWRKAGIRERLENQVPVVVDVLHVGDAANINKNHASKLLPETVTVRKVIGDVVVSRNGVRESLHHSRSVAKLDVIPKLKEITERSEYLGAMNDFSGKEIVNHYFATKILHDGREKIVFLRVRERNNTKNFYVHDVFVEEDIKKASSLQTSPLGHNDFAKIRGTGLYRLILQDIYAVDKDSVSKVVDENGEPMMMYHQTRSPDITVFDIRRKGAGETDSETPFGVFLKPTNADIGLGDVQMPLFANIRNPVRFRDRDAVDRYLRDNADGYAQKKRSSDSDGQGLSEEI